VKVTERELAGVLYIEPRLFGDDRGYFLETFHAERYRAAGIEGSFVQDNVSKSRRGVVRGLHFQWPNPQGKLVTVLAGEIYDAAVDIRVGSPTFGKSAGVTLSAETHAQLWVPPGYAHGFCALSDDTVVAYKCTALYDPASESSLLWSDPDLAIAWPSCAASLSTKDAAAPRLRDIARERLPTFAP
jgi:dTDP-4-dehydrorhamnose 3,5-epimerase